MKKSESKQRMSHVTAVKVEAPKARTVTAYTPSRSGPQYERKSYTAQVPQAESVKILPRGRKN